MKNPKLEKVEFTKKLKRCEHKNRSVELVMHYHADFYKRKPRADESCYTVAFRCLDCGSVRQIVGDFVKIEEEVRKFRGPMGTRLDSDILCGDLFMYCHQMLNGKIA